MTALYTRELSVLTGPPNSRAAERRRHFAHGPLRHNFSADEVRAARGSEGAPRFQLPKRIYQ